MKNVLTPARGAVAAVLMIGLALPAMSQSDFRRTLNTGEQATRRAEQVQDQINQLDDERTDLLGEYRTLIQRQQAASLFAAQQQRVVDSQIEEIASLEEQLTRVDEITAETIPLMLDMITDLDAFVSADLPFKQQLRKDRIDSLRAAMDDPQIPTPEAYRLIIEAYQAEMEYGRTIDTWKENVNIEGTDVTVDMFQYGRVALVYLTPDQRNAARYDRASGTWQPLSRSYVADIVQAIRIAEGKAPQAILAGPVQKFAVQ